MGGVTAVPRGWQPCAHMCLFVFPPLLVGVELGCVCGTAAVFCRYVAADLKLLWTKGHDKLDVGVS
jgi:hypothetical protein